MSESNENTHVNGKAEELKAAADQATENAEAKAAEAEGAAEAGAENATEHDTEKTTEKAVEPEKLAQEWKERAAYLAAEIENMKKRFTRERTDLMKMANEELLKGILPVYDNLELALKSIRENAAKDQEMGEAAAAVVGNLAKGVDMTLLHFNQTLERLGVQKIDAEGKNFDPQFHEAMGQSQEAEVPDNQVTSVFQQGFILHGRVIRPAKVIVNKKGEA